MKQMPYEPGSGRSTAPGAPDIKFHYERLASDPRCSWPRLVHQQRGAIRDDIQLLTLLE